MSITPQSQNFRIVKARCHAFDSAIDGGSLSDLFVMDQLLVLFDLHQVRG